MKFGEDTKLGTQISQGLYFDRKVNTPPFFGVVIGR